MSVVINTVLRHKARELNIAIDQYGFVFWNDLCKLNRIKNLGRITMDDLVTLLHHGIDDSHLAVSICPIKCGWLIL